jgi:Leucine-rich repeat (LRR) protein/type II secretory pathway pseudopilin PulG
VKQHPPSSRKASAGLNNEAGAFDLPSILVGVTVVGVLTAGVLASVFGVIPYAQDAGAKQDLSAVRTAQGTAKAQKGAFLNQSALSGSGLVGNLGDRITVTSSSGAQFCATATSQTGKIFSITESISEPVEDNFCDVWTIPDPVLRAAVVAKLAAAAPGIAPASFMTSSAGEFPMVRTAEEAPVQLTLRDAAKLTDLDLTGSGVTSLEGIQEAVNLKTINISDTPLTDLTPLVAVTGLAGVSMNETHVTNIAPLAMMPNLASVDAMGTNIPDWSPLNHVATVNAPWSVTDANLRNRITSTLGTGSAPLTIADARRLGELDEVSVMWTDFTPLKAAINARVSVYPETQAQLNRVHLVQNVTDLKATTVAPGYPGYDDPITNISSLTGITTLKNVELYNMRITDISALSGMTSIESLNLPRMSSIAPVATMPNLENLWLSMDGNTPDLSPIAGLTKLKTLNVPTVVSDFSAIASIHSLENISLDGNRNVTSQSLAQFGGLENLKRVSLTGTPASEGGYDTDWTPLNHVGLVDGRPVNANLTEAQRQAAWVIPDQVVRQAVAMSVGKAPEDLIIADANRLDMLWGPMDGATSLEGLQYAGNLMDLDISNSSISDLSPLAGLGGLMSVNAMGTPVTDWSPVAHVENVMGRP